VTFVIRDAGPADTAALRDVYRRASLSNDGDRASLLASPDALEFPGPATGDGHTRAAVATDGRVVGFATTLIARDAAELDDLFVDPGWMRRGIGRALVLDAIEIARHRGIGRVEVTANPHALVFYQRAGFTVDHEVATRFGPGSRMHVNVVP